MAEFKLVLSTKDGKSYQHPAKGKDAIPFLGKKIGDTVKGDDFGMPGYEVQITGGSDHCGFPMRSDIQGTGRKRILAVQGVGVKKKGKGQRQRKTLCGNTVHGKIAQVNLKVIKEGKSKLGAGAKEETKDTSDKDGSDAKPTAQGTKDAKPEAKEAKPEAKEPAKAPVEKPEESKKAPEK